MQCIESSNADCMQGLIIVEYTNTSLVREAIQRGIITTTTTTESVSYSVKSVVHPVTGDLISVLQAVEEGIIDPTNGRLVLLMSRYFCLSTLTMIL